jgi:hypothetical protein
VKLLCKFFSCSLHPLFRKLSLAEPILRPACAARLVNWHGKRSSNDEVPVRAKGISAQLRSDFREPRAKGLRELHKNSAVREKFACKRKEFVCYLRNTIIRAALGTLTKSP